MSGLPIEPVERDDQPFFRRSPADVRGLDHGVLKMRGDNLDVFAIKRDELETVHNPAFVLSTERKVGRRLRCARLKSPSRPRNTPPLTTSLSCPTEAGHPVVPAFRIDLQVVITGSPAGACHRAAFRADPLAGDDSRDSNFK